MNSMGLFLTIFTCTIFSLFAQEGQIDQLSHEIKELGEAGDFENAVHLTEELLVEPLPDWQHSRALYNLGTLQLSQQQTDQAIAAFQKISPSDLLLPEFGARLLINEGIAFLQAAEQFSSSSSPFFDEQGLMIQHALQFFQQAKSINSAEEGSQSLINRWIAFAEKRHEAFLALKEENEAKQADSESSGNKQGGKPAAILKKALESAHLALQASLLSVMKEEKQEKRSSLLDTQREVVKQSSLFIPSVLDEQKTLFQNAQGNVACQKFKWERIIPLFDRGNQSAENGEKLLASSTHLNQVQMEQAETIRNWSQALFFLEDPLQQNAVEMTPAQGLRESFRLVQEMYMNDQPAPEPTAVEMHSW